MSIKPGSPRRTGRRRGRSARRLTLPPDWFPPRRTSNSSPPLPGRAGPCGAVVVMSNFRQAIQRFMPWLTLVAVYLALGLIGRVVLWAKFGVEADVSATHLPFLVAGGLVNDLVQSLYLF